MHARHIGVAATLALTLTLLPTGPAGGEGEPIRGITLSTHTDGSDWSQQGTASAFAAMRDIGANWVAIHPYAGVQRDGSVRYRPLDPDHPPDWITRPIREAHALGLKLLIKPHLAYWGSGFSWRGEIGFDTPEQWDHFWSTYTAWITDLARVCGEADGFVVGTELSRTQDQSSAWRRVIADVRACSSLPLTYAANWHDYRSVDFWDALDVIGIQAYFPVAEVADADEDALCRGWERRMAELRAYSEQWGKPIVFTELGYNWSFNAPVEPWDYHVDGEAAEAVQLRCLRTALQAVEAEPAVTGAFLWKWFPDPYPVGRNFPLATRGAKQVIAEVWRGD